MNINTVLNPLLRCTYSSDKDLYIGTSFEVVEEIPANIKKNKIVTTVLEHIDTEIVPLIKDSKEANTVKKCEKLRELIPLYCSKFKEEMGDKTAQAKMRLLIERIQMEELRWGHQNRVSRGIQSLAGYQTKMQPDLRRNMDRISVNEAYYAYINSLQERLVILDNLHTMNALLDPFREIFKLLDKWREVIAIEGVHETEKGVMIVIPTIKTMDAFEMSLQLKAFDELKAQIKSVCIYGSSKTCLRLRIPIWKTLHEYKRSRPDREYFCNALEECLTINIQFIFLQMFDMVAGDTLETPIETGIPRDWKSVEPIGYITDFARASCANLKRLLQTIYQDKCDIDYKKVLAEYDLEKDRITKEVANKKEEEQFKNDALILISLAKLYHKYSTQTMTIRSHKYKKGSLAAKINIVNNMVSRFCTQIDTLSAPESRGRSIFQFVKEIPEEIADSTSGSTTTSEDTFLPDRFKMQLQAKRVFKKKKTLKPKAVAKCEPDSFLVKPEIPTLHVAFENLSVTEKTERIDEFSGWRTLFQDPKIIRHSRVLRWKRKDALDIFITDPIYSKKSFSDSAKRRIIFEHGFADAVAAVAMKEGNSTTNEADRIAYGAVRRVQVVGEVLFDDTEERIQGVFSFSQGKDGVWFHVGFTAQESEASCRNYLKLGLYCVEYPPLSMVTEEVHDIKSPSFFDDGSYITNITPYVVTIRDPLGATISLARIKS